MAFKLPNNVQETTTTTGTGAYACAGAVAGALAFASQLSVNDKTIICVFDASNLEICEATYTSPGGITTLSRDVVIFSTNGGSPVNWGSGTRNIIVGQPGESLKSLLDPAAPNGMLERTAKYTYTAVAKAGAATANTIPVRDASGRMKAAAPSATDDVARVFEINVVTALANAKVLKAGDTMTGFLTLVGNPTSPLHSAPKQYVDLMAVGRSSCRKNRSKNNTTTPNTQFDLTASQVIVRDSGDHLAVLNSPGTITCNVSTAGPAANGRDQAGAFSAASWVHFWWIWNPTTATLATIASSSGTAPAALPSGYTYTAYCGAVYFNGSSQLLSTRFHGSWATYTNQQAINEGGSTSYASVSVLCPDNAIAIRLWCIQGGSASANGYVQFSEDGVMDSIIVALMTPSGGVSLAGGHIILNIVTQAFHYKVTPSGVKVDVYTTGYQVPNGDQ